MKIKRPKTIGILSILVLALLGGGIAYETNKQHNSTVKHQSTKPPEVKEDQEADKIESSIENSSNTKQNFPTEESNNNSTYSSNNFNQENNESDWTQGIPPELIGVYTAYDENGNAIATLEFGKAISTIQSDGSYMHYYLKPTKTSCFSSDIKYKRLGNGHYLLNYNISKTNDAKNQIQELVVGDYRWYFLGYTFIKEIYTWIDPNSPAGQLNYEESNLHDSENINANEEDNKNLDINNEDSSAEVEEDIPN